jgi:hypothetical protein
MTSRSCFAFSTTMRVVYGIHDDSPNGRPDTAPTLRSRFPDGPQIMFLVSDLAYRRAAVHMYFSDLAGPQAQLRIVTLPGKQLYRCSGGASKLRPFARHHFYAMNRAAHRNIA